MAKLSISRALSRYTLNLSYADLPKEVRARAKNLILDALGTAISGRELPWSRAAAKSVKGSRGKATMWGYTRKVTAADAAFVNSVQVTSTAHEDVLYKTHPGIVNVPTALAVAEAENSPGDEVIAALVAAYDLIGRTYLGSPDITKKFRGVPVFGPFGAVAAAGRLSRLTEDQMVNALGFAANYSSGLVECWQAGTMEGNFHGGMAARTGIISVTLAKLGVTAAESTFEGDHGFYHSFAGTLEKTAEITADLGKRFMIMEVLYKPYPACFGQQFNIDLILQMVARDRIKADDIVEVVETVSEAEKRFPGPTSPGRSSRTPRRCLAPSFAARPLSSAGP